MSLNLVEIRLLFRGFAGETWKAIERQVGDRLEAGPLASDSPLVQLLVAGKGYTVQYVFQEPLPDTDPHSPELVQLLDARLVPEPTR